MINSLISHGVHWPAPEIKIGDLHQGVPELRPSSRYNTDSKTITEHFSIGVDMLNVIVETVDDGCIDYEVMENIDTFAWQMTNTTGVQSVIGLPGIAKVINAGWSEGALKWRVLPRNRQVLVEAVQYIPTSSGLLNADCSIMPVMIFTSDHKAETISHVVQTVKAYQAENGTDRVKFRLATGNVGVMAATNEEVSAAQFPILVYVFSAIIILCLITFRSIRATLAITLPLGLVSLLAYALMTQLEIGLKVSTLPVVALGVGVGVVVVVVVGVVVVVVAPSSVWSSVLCVVVVVVDVIVLACRCRVQLLYSLSCRQSPV